MHERLQYMGIWANGVRLDGLVGHGQAKATRAGVGMTMKHRSLGKVGPYTNELAAGKGDLAELDGGNVALLCAGAWALSTHPIAIGPRRWPQPTRFSVPL